MQYPRSAHLICAVRRRPGALPLHCLVLDGVYSDWKGSCAAGGRRMRPSHRAVHTGQEQVAVVAEPEPT